MTEAEGRDIPDSISCVIYYVFEVSSDLMNIKWVRRMET